MNGTTDGVGAIRMGDEEYISVRVITDAYGVPVEEIIRVVHELPIRTAIYKGEVFLHLEVIEAIFGIVTAARYN